MSTPPPDERRGLPSASGLDRIMRCPGSVALVAQVVGDRGSQWTERGTKIHAVLEGKINLDDLNPSDKVTASRIMDVEAQMVDNCAMEGAEVISERRLWAFGDAWSGKLDRLHRHGNVGLLIDFKTGWGQPVPVAESWQMKGLAVLVHETFEIDTLVAAVIHPNSPDGRSSVRTEWGADEIEVFGLQIADTLAHLQDAPRTAGKHQCQWCPARQVCPEYQAQAHASEGDGGTLAPRPSWERMTPAERGQRLHQIVALRKQLEAEEGAMRLMLETDPASVDGWYLKPGQTRQIYDHPAAYEIIKAAADEAFALSVMRVGMGELEKGLSTRGMTKRQAKEWIDKALGELIVSKPSEPKLLEKPTETT